MTDNEIKREKTFSEELPYFKERIKEVFDNYHNLNGGKDPLYIAVLRDGYRIVRKSEEEITRQQAEIEKLESANDEKFSQWYMLTEKTKQHYADLYNEAKDILKAEAIKEFADRLKEKSFKTIRNYGLTKDVVEVCDIDNLVKEMVGEYDI